MLTREQNDAIFGPSIRVFRLIASATTDHPLTKERLPSVPMQEFASVLTQSALRTYMSVEGLAGHPQFPAEIGDLRFGLAHRR
jgi:hypothetical protein